MFSRGSVAADVEHKKFFCAFPFRVGLAFAFFCSHFSHLRKRGVVPRYDDEVVPRVPRDALVGKVLEHRERRVRVPSCREKHNFKTISSASSLFRFARFQRFQRNTWRCPEAVRPVGAVQHGMFAGQGERRRIRDLQVPADAPLSAAALRLFV